MVINTKPEELSFNQKSDRVFPIFRSYASSLEYGLDMLFIENSLATPKPEDQFSCIGNRRTPLC